MLSLESMEVSTVAALWKILIFHFHTSSSEDYGLIPQATAISTNDDQSLQNGPRVRLPPNKEGSA
jgi:hypothetical protein